MTRRALFFFAALLFGPGPMMAQISPGPLARAHQDLDSPLRCTTCHAGGRTALSRNCLACHKDIGWLVERNRGYHAAQASATCASCHPDHAGADFALIKWPDANPESFDHERAGWPLQGKHATTPCADCHTAKFRISQAATLSVRKSAAGWVGLETSCTSCHADPHRGGLGKNCATCHTAARWDSTPHFDHARTRYPLTGRHAAVRCNDCHVNARLGPRPVFRGLAFAECSACHTDPHAGRLGGKCANCHVTTGFAVLGGGATSFEHERTRYPLRGAHRQTACDKCHDFSGRAGARRDPPAFATCTACHRDPHAGTATLAGQVVDCDACHGMDAFVPATFTVARHRATRYPLDGGHAQVRCASCHRTAAGVTVLHPTFARCRDCHTTDPHRGDPARDCVVCHDTRAYKPSTVDVAAHAHFTFALEGAHRAVPCAACHRDMKTFTAANTCAACHAGPHGTQFAARPDKGRCDACHDVNAWRPASRFDHAKDAGFSLEGAHARVACERCHRPAAGRPVVYGAASPRCESCHTGGGRRQ